MENPCGVLYYRQRRSSKEVADSTAAFLLQMLIGLSKIQYWMDDFVSKIYLSA